MSSASTLPWKPKPEGAPHTSILFVTRRPALRITPEKAILKPDDRIEAELESSVPQPRVRVEVVQTDTRLSWVPGG